MNFIQYRSKLFIDLLNKYTSVRLIGTSNVLEGRSYTKESGVVPGSSEYFEPNKWTERLVELHKLQKLDLSKPSQLHMVMLLNKKRIAYYYRVILEKYGLLRLKPFSYQIVKNTPSVNEDLLKVSAFIKVVPIKFPHGIPKSPEDFLNAKLLPNGNLILHTGLKIDGSIIDENDISDDKKVKALIYQYNKHTERSLNGGIYIGHNNIAWKRNRFLKDYFSNHYQYKHNQDGKEYRYSNMWRITDALKQSIGRRYNEDGTLRMNFNQEADWNTYPWRNY